MKIVQMQYKAKDRKNFNKYFPEAKPEDVIVHTCWSAAILGMDKAMEIDYNYGETSIKEQDETLGIQLEDMKKEKFSRTVIEITGIEKYKTKDVTNPTFQKYAALLPALINFQQITAPAVARVLGTQKLQARNIIDELEKAEILKRVYTFWTIPKHVRAQVRNHLMGESGTAIPVAILAPGAVREKKDTKPRYGKLEEIYKQRLDRAEIKWQDKHSHYDKKLDEKIDDYDQDELAAYHDKLVTFFERLQITVNTAGYEGAGLEKQRKIDAKIMKNIPIK